jgi:hypothetical protein
MIEVEVKDDGFRGEVGGVYFSARVLVVSWLEAPAGAEVYVDDPAGYPRAAGDEVLVHFDELFVDEQPGAARLVEWQSVASCRPEVPITPPLFFNDLNVGEPVELRHEGGWWPAVLRQKTQR